MSKQNKFLPVPDAIEQVTDRRPHPATCWRWAIQGSGGVILQTWMIGGRRCTTVEAVRSFIESRTSQTTPSSGVSKVREKLNRELGLS